MEMCAQGMEWDLLYVLQMSKLRTFQELATKAHHMEMTRATRCGQASLTSEATKDKGGFKKSSKASKILTKESMSVSTSEQVRISRKLRPYLAKLVVQVADSGSGSG